MRLHEKDIPHKHEAYGFEYLKIPMTEEESKIVKNTLRETVGDKEFERIQKETQKEIRAYEAYIKNQLGFGPFLKSRIFDLNIV